MEFPFFHGKITRKACEELLCKNGKNGSYLIRESESVEGALCLCVFLTVDEKHNVYNVFHSFEELIYTYRLLTNFIFLSLQTSEGIPEKVFRTLKDLIYNYEKPNQGLVTNLRYPVKKTSFRGPVPPTGACASVSSGGL
uniref:SH2 domain-containing protein n=1 Tax=Anas platyrhynchos platyrhynchos TaxID=8840 RepID=A0A493TVP1_ANAPP